MSEEVASAAPAPAVEAPAPAPVAPAPSVDSAPAPEASIPEAPAFAWTDWDGTEDSIPEDSREAFSAISRKFSEEYKEREGEIESLRAMYAAMLNDEEDPRLAEMTKKFQELEEEHKQKLEAFSELEGQHSSFVEQSANEYVERFWKEHPELSQDQEKLGVFINLIDENNEFGGQWDGYIAAELLSLSEDAFQVAVSAKEDGVSDIYALKLAKAHAEIEEVKNQPSPQEVKAAQAKAKAEAKAKAPRRGAKITNGATTSSRPTKATEGMGDATSLDDLRSLAARRALRVHGGGRN
tara:strand:- start:537 stop:1421 length:885 start_codon:yes stop_codon:yes gene_type:complete